MTRIRLRKNGPYLVEDRDVQVVDWEGHEYRVDRWPLALCRCGGSAKKPFCDGTHSKIGFVDDQPASDAPAGSTEES